MSESETFLEAAERDLLAPAASVDIAALARLWRWDEARVVCARPSDLEDTPDLALRIRGALGRVLRSQAAQPRRADPWGRPSAFEVLYEWPPPRQAGFEVARPFVVRADVRGPEVTAAARLFGWAGLYVEDVGEALWNALAGGVALRAGGRHRVPFHPLAVTVERVEGVDIAGPAGSAELIFESPTVIRRDGELTLRPAAMPMAAVRRAASLAPWMEIGLAHDARALRQACRALTYRMEGLTPSRWIRHSIRRPDAPIPVYAFQGRIGMAGNLEPLVPYLRLAETCGLGSHAALGFGRVRVALY